MKLKLTQKDIKKINLSKMNMGNIYTSITMIKENIQKFKNEILAMTENVRYANTNYQKRICQKQLSLAKLYQKLLENELKKRKKTEISEQYFEQKY